MSTVTDKTALIRSAIYGKDVRENIASGLETIDGEIVSNTASQTALGISQTALNSQFTDVLKNTTAQSPNNAELVAAHTSTVTGLTKDTIGHRVDEIDSSLAQKATLIQQKYFKQSLQFSSKLSFYDNFVNYGDGDINGQSLYTRYGGTESILNHQLQVSTPTVYDKGLIINRVFSEGSIKILVKKDANYFCLNFKHSLLNDSGRYCIWNMAGSEIQFGFIAVGATNLTAKATGIAIPSEDYFVEITVPTMYVGAIIEIRIWGKSAIRPTSPTSTYTIATGDPLPDDGYISFNTISATNVTIQEVTISDGKALYQIPKNLVYYVGRWFPKIVNGIDTMTTVNQGSEFYFKVGNTTLTLLNFINISTANNAPFISYSVDGGAFTRVSLQSDPTVYIYGLSIGKEHIIRVVASGIQEADSIWLQGEGLVFKGITVDTNGYSKPYIPIGKRIMAIGDSITAGINVLGVGAIPTNNVGELAYLHICCNQLKAMPLQVGFGATGVLRGGSGLVPWCQNYINYVISTKFSNDETPDVIILNHGSNDSTSSDSDFTVAYQNVVNMLKIKFPSTPIFCINPFTTHYHALQIQEIAEVTTDCFYIDSTGWVITTNDGVHPDVAGHLLAGTNITTAITNILGAEFFS